MVALFKIDFSKIQEKCTNEAQTRLYLIDQIITILGYSIKDDVLTEINAGWGNKRDKADMGLIVKDKKNPEIIIECKTLGKKLTDNQEAFSIKALEVIEFLNNQNQTDEKEQQNEESLDEKSEETRQL